MRLIWVTKYILTDNWEINKLILVHCIIKGKFLELKFIDTSNKVTMVKNIFLHI